MNEDNIDERLIRLFDSDNDESTSMDLWLKANSVEDWLLATGGKPGKDYDKRDLYLLSMLFYMATRLR